MRNRIKRIASINARTVRKFLVRLQMPVSSFTAFSVFNPFNSWAVAVPRRLICGKIYPLSMIPRYIHRG